MHVSSTFFIRLLVLERLIFYGNILIVQACAQCFLIEKLLKNKNVVAKDAKIWGKGQPYLYSYISKLKTFLWATKKGQKDVNVK